MGARGQTLAHAVAPVAWRKDRRSWRFPLGVFALTQAIAAVTFVIVSGGRYTDLAGSWDGGFYHWIVTHGYSVTPPGVGGEGQYAFFPLYPFLARAVATVTPLGVQAAGQLISLAAGAVAVVLLSRLVERYVDRVAAWTVTVAVCAWPAAPVMQMFYTESLALLLLVSAYWLLLRRRYLPLVGVLALLALCRPLAAPFVVVVAAHGLTVWRDRSARWKTVGLAITCGLLAVAWPVAAWIMTGEPLIYLRAMRYFASGGLQTWGEVALTWGPAGWTLLALGVGVVAWVVVRCMPSRTPLELRAWAVAYPLYLAAGTYTTGSVLRYLLLCFPLALLWVPLVRWRWWTLVGLGIAGVLSSVWWVALFPGGTVGPIP